MPTVLVILANGFEEIEAMAPVDLLRRAGVEVTLASLPASRRVTGRSGVTVHADSGLSQLGGQSFDMIFLPGGPGVKNLRADPRVGEVIRRHTPGESLAGRHLRRADRPARLRSARRPALHCALFRGLGVDPDPGG